MSSTLRMVLVLTGAHAWKTIKLNGCQFTDGAIELIGTDSDVLNVARYLAKSYQAHPLYSEELARAGVRDGVDYGQRYFQACAQRDADNEVQSGIQPDREGASEVSAIDGTGAAEDAARTEGSVPLGNGHADTGTSGNAWPGTEGRLGKALRLLDPKNDEHWTKDGRPAMAAVEAMFGSAGLTRKMIEVAVPGFNRETARG